MNINEDWLLWIVGASIVVLLSVLVGIVIVLI